MTCTALTAIHMGINSTLGSYGNNTMDIRVTTMAVIDMGSDTDDINLQPANLQVKFVMIQMKSIAMIG